MRRDLGALAAAVSFERTAETFDDTQDLAGPTTGRGRGGRATLRVESDADSGRAPAHPTFAAFTYGREKNHPEALKYLDLALAANPNDATLLQLAAASAMEVSDYPRAMGYLGRIDEAALTDPELMVNAAMNLLNRRRSAEAATLLTRVIARFPASADAYFYRGYASLQANKPAEAKPDLEQYLKLAAPDAPPVAQAREMLSRIQ